MAFVSWMSLVVLDTADVENFVSAVVPSGGRFVTNVVVDLLDFYTSWNNDPTFHMSNRWHLQQNIALFWFGVHNCDNWPAPLLRTDCYWLAFGNALLEADLLVHGPGLQDVMYALTMAHALGRVRLLSNKSFSRTRSLATPRTIWSLNTELITAFVP